MRVTTATAAWPRVVRWLALGAALLVLGGCATGYSFVQPEAGGAGAYYRGDAYAAAGTWGANVDYPGVAGFGYYGGWPYAAAGGWYAGFGYTSPFVLGFGFANVWGSPGYGYPWYAGGYPAWGCGWRCHPRRGRYWAHRGHHRPPGHRWQRIGSPAADAPPWRRSLAGGAPAGAAEFAHRAFVHAPATQAWQPQTGNRRPQRMAPAWAVRPMARGFAEGMPRTRPPAFRGNPRVRAEPAFRAVPRFAPTPAIEVSAPQPAARGGHLRREVR